MQLPPLTLSTPRAEWDPRAASRPAAGLRGATTVQATPAPATPTRKLRLFALTGKSRTLARVEGQLRHWLRGLSPAMSAISPVRPNLLISGLAGAYHSEALQALGVDLVFSCLGDTFNFWPGQFAYESVRLLDEAGQAIAPGMVADALHAQLQAGHRVLVHCRHGRSRSATVILAYLMKYEGLRLEEALEELRSHRGLVRPNTGFMRQLRVWEANGLRD